MARALRAVALAAICGFCICSCGSPQSEFEDELDELFDKLVADLEAYAAGDIVVDAEGTASWHEGGQLMMNPDASLPTNRSWFIISWAEDIQEHFGRVSLEFLQQDPDDFEAWGKSLQQRYDARRAEVSALLEQVDENYRSSTYDYNTFSAIGGGLGTSRDDRVYFMRGDRGYYIDEMIDIDIEEWIAAVKDEMKKLQ